VRQGEFVHEGQPLLTINTTHIAANGADLDAHTQQTLLKQKAELQRNVQAEDRRSDSERERLQAAASASEKQISAIRTQIAIQSQRLALAEKDVSSAAELRQHGIMSAIEYNRREAQRLQQKQGLESLNQQLTAEQAKLADSQFALQQLPTVMAQKVQALRNDLSSVEQRLADVQGRSAYVVSAPVSGKIGTLQASVGETADPHRLQLEIIPEDSPLQAELLVPSRAIGFIEAGQKVRLLYDAFPYQQFGTYTGHVVRVSQTLVTASDAGGPIRLKEPAYRVTAALDRPYVDAYGKRMPLQPDMLLRADVILEKRSLASWLLAPVHVRM
jgi:membrane fusion protein